MKELIKKSPFLKKNVFNYLFCYVYYFIIIIYLFVPTNDTRMTPFDTPTAVATG